MSTQNAGALSSTDTEDSEETIEVPREEYERLVSQEERIDELESAVKELTRRADIHDSRLDGTTDSIERVENEFEEYRADNERDKADIRKFAKEKAEEAGSGDANPTPDGEENARAEEKTPIERVLDDPDKSGVRVTASVQRAMSIAGHFREWSESVKAGRVIRGGLKKLLSAATDEKLAWRQVYRAAEALEDLTNGGMRFEKHRRHGWMIVLDDEQLLSRVVSGG